MKKLIAIFIVTLFSFQSFGIAETFVDRARVIMARVKDDKSPLDSKASAAISIKYADAFIKALRPDLLQDENGNPIDLSTISNEDKGKAYINELRKFHKAVLRGSRISTVQTTARKAEEAKINTEFSDDFGEKE